MAHTEPDTSSDSALSRWLQDHAVAVGVLAAVAMAAVVVMGVVLLTGDEPLPPVATEMTDDPPDSAPPSTGADDLSALVAVKVDNAPRARPPIGLNAARYVLEAPVEGGLTRFLALFSPGEALVGPVRSARPVDVDLVPAFSDVLVSTGGRPFVVGPLRDNGVVMVGSDPEDTPFQRLERPVPHNQFVSLADVPAPDPAGGFPVGEWPEEAEASPPPEVAYPAPVEWSFADGVYSRAEDGETFEVLSDWGAEPEPLTTSTVVVMEVNQRSAGYTDVNGAEVPTFDVIGSGRLTVHHGGETLSGVWSRASLAERYVLRSEDGSPFGLPDGRAFVHLLPRSTSGG